MLTNVSEEEEEEEDSFASIINIFLGHSSFCAHSFLFVSDRLSEHSSLFHALCTTIN